MEAGALGSVARLCGVGLRAIPSATRSYYASDTKKNHMSYLGSWFNFFKPAPCVGCLPTERPQAPSPEPADTPQRTMLSEHATGCVDHGAWLHVAHGACSTTMGGDPRTDQRPTRADRARALRRATISRTGGQRPKDRQADATL